MRRIRVALLTLTTVLVLLTSGCNLVRKYEFSRAQRLESQGKLEDAIVVYTKLANETSASSPKERSLVYLHMGECWLKAGRPGDAFSSFQKSAEIDVSNTVAQLRLGEMYLAGGANERASEQAQKVLQIAAANTDGMALLGAASSAAGDIKLAEQAFETVLKSEPQRVRVAIALANIYNDQEEVDKARQTLKNASAVQPSSALPLLALGRLEEQEGNTSAAEEAYRRAVSTEDSVETSTRLAKFLARTSRPDEAARVLLHADLLGRELPAARADFKLLAGYPETALDQYADVLSSSPADQSGFSLWAKKSEPRTAEIRARLAVRAIEADLEIAESQAKSDPSMKPATGAARLHLSAYRNVLDPATLEILEAEIALAERDLISASSHAHNALKIAPESAAAHYVNGIVKHRSGDPVSARTEWSQSLEQDPNYAPARLALAEDAVVRGDFPGAEEYVVPVVRDEPENLRALNIFSRVLIGEKRYDAAILIARRAMMLNDDSAEPHLLLAKVAAAQNNYANALREFEKAMSLQPRSEEAMRGLLQLYRKGRISKAMLAKLEHVAATAPPSAPLMEISGRMYAERGWSVDAQRCLAKSLEIDPYRVTALSELAKSDLMRGDYNRAVELGARRGGPDSALLNAFSAERRHDLSAAANEYEKAVRQGEQSGIAANNLAWILAETGSDLERALMLAQQAKSLRPDNPAVLDTLGFVYLQRHEYSSAIPVLKQAAEVAQRKGATTEHDAIQHHLDLALLRSGQSPAAH